MTELPPIPPPRPQQASILAAIGQAALKSPAVMACLVLSLLGAAMPEWLMPWLHWFTFQDFVVVSPQQVYFVDLETSLAQGQYWRFITPIFIHFGIFHIAFNGLWLWEFGRRIESLAGSLHVLLLIAVIGVVSNVSQYLWSDMSIFGGMSGVLYGLLGYIWIRQRLAPSVELQLPVGILRFMLIWLVLCMSGLVGFLFGADIANAAHVSGLLCGMMLGAVWGVFKRVA